MLIYFLVILGFVLLIYGGNILVDGAVAVAKHLKVSPLLIGLTLVGFGTSVPELITSLFAAGMHAEGIAVGNVVGSNIINILLVLGTAAVIREVVIHKEAFKRDAVFLSISTLVLGVALLIGRINALMGLIMCGILVFYTIYAYRMDVEQEKKAQPVTPSTMPHRTRHYIFYSKELWLSVAKTALGILLTIAGAKVLVENAVVLAERWGVSETVIGLTVVALGTSVPELMTSIIASLKNHSSLAFGNIVGSNIYNALFILGFTALFVPVEVPRYIFCDVLIMMGVTGLLLYFGHNGRLSRREGCIFIGLYGAYLVYLAVGTLF